MEVKMFVERLRKEMQYCIFLPENDISMRESYRGTLSNLLSKVSYLPGSLSGLSGSLVINRAELAKKKEKSDFARELQRIIHDKSRSASLEYLCRKIGLDKSYLYKLLKAEKTPSRDLCIRLSLALHLGRSETIKLISLLGYGLFEHVKRDFVLLRCLDERLEPDEADEVLIQVGIVPLKS